ncbi:FTR1 family protein [Paenibacillus sp. GP183]|uniref:FTR1 family iron permease n=1 Tax=Paenibacillus sp. GP183 TaxID=1882751 RepID=UPI00089D2968|nr:FTR1 family protein [Paenibacillus sp. GP183]SEB54177.1 high-affinity iron transporter [Paenibacillus sp. GP183]
MKKVISIWFTCMLIYIWIQPGAVMASVKANPDFQAANQFVLTALQKAEQGDNKSALEQFKNFQSKWYEVEDGVKKQSTAAYKEIEDLMGQVQFAFAKQPLDASMVKESLHQLAQLNESIINGTFVSKASSSKNGRTVTLADLTALLEDALVKLDASDVTGAKQNIERFRQSWLEVEGLILSQSDQVYKSTEKNMVTSYAALASTTPDLESAKQIIRQMSQDLTPLAKKTSYTLFDASAILLREGLEALLIIVALLGFLKKSGNEQKKPWIWYGVGSGLGISIILGVIVQVLFSAGAFGKNNFLITGWTGLFAASMLFYMSYWLHSKSSMHVWQSYIQNKGNQALAKGSLWSLAVLAFLAVFREGTETVLFFIGMASSITLVTLLSGIALGILILAVLAFLIFYLGMRIPMRPFFLVSSVLVFYLCFKFTGMGVHGLQLAGLLPATNLNVPSFTSIAVYPTLESFIPQVLLLAIAITVVIWNFIKGRRIHKRLIKS